MMKNQQRRDHRKQQHALNSRALHEYENEHDHAGGAAGRFNNVDELMDQMGIELD